MSDAEDPNQFAKERPVSTIARSFSAQLNDAFLIDDTLDQLSSTVEQKKLSVTFHSKELEELEARIRRADALLEEKKKRFSQQLPGQQLPDPSAPSTHRARQPMTNYDQPESSQAAAAPPSRSAPAPPVANGGSAEGGFVVIEKTASMPGESGNPPSAAAPGTGQSERRFGEQYSARPPPPVPT